MPSYSGPVTPDWVFIDDTTNEKIERISQGGFPPQPEEILSVGKHPRWLVTNIGELYVDDWSKSPPILHFPIFGHSI